MNIWICFRPGRVCRIRTGCFSLPSLRQSADVHNVSEHLVGERKTHFKKCDILCLLQSLCSEPPKSSTSNLLLFSFNKNLKNCYCRVSFFSLRDQKWFQISIFFRFRVKVRNSSRLITAADDRSPDVRILQISSLKSNIHISALFPSTNRAPPDRLWNFCCDWNRLEDFMRTCDPHFDINCLDLVSEINFWSAVILRAPISLFYRLWYSLSLLLLF